MFDEEGETEELLRSKKMVIGVNAFDEIDRLVDDGTIEKRVKNRLF